MPKVIVKIENDYEDGHHSERQVELPAPGRDLEDWWEETVFPETGDGHAADNDLGTCYTATIVGGQVPSLVGEEREWV